MVASRLKKVKKNVIIIPSPRIPLRSLEGSCISAFVFMAVYLLPEQSDLYFQFPRGAGLFVSRLAGGCSIRSYQERRGCSLEARGRPALCIDGWA